ncbi:MAG: DUF1330 domain-containing protein [Alphaproteobacteria bacterium]|nr:DUF1330 domain-containing protein [Alphaproteobacteria bacterium]
MSAYIVVRVKVTDPEQYKRYTARTPDCIASFGGRFIVRGGEPVTLEGPKFDDRMVIIEFPSLERAKEFYNSPEYTEIKALRANAAVGEFVAVDGAD